jgi:hypothetical protein
MKAMREVGKQREVLTVDFVSRSEEKKWGDWELCESVESYKRGKKVPFKW